MPRPRTLFTIGSLVCALTCGLLLVSALKSSYRGDFDPLRRLETPAPRLVGTPDPAPPNATLQPPPVGSTFDIDVSRSLDVLDTLPLTERPEQIADWVVYATLAHARIDADGIRSATYDRLPIRNTVFDDAVNVEYGRGRRAALSDGSAWLFHSSRDPHAVATIARLADQVRMERGEKPNRFSVFVFETALDSGVIHVRHDKDLTPEQLFSPEFGYIEARVETPEQLTAWLSQIDDLTHVKRDESGVTLGGRRLSDARTHGIGVEDVAALYRAHVWIGQREKACEDEATGAAKPLKDAWERFVDAFNHQVALFNSNNSATLDEAALVSAEHAVNKLMPESSAVSQNASPKTDQPKGRKQKAGDATDQASDEEIIGQLFKDGDAKPSVEELMERLKRNGDPFGHLKPGGSWPTTSQSQSANDALLKRWDTRIEKLAPKVRAAIEHRAKTAWEEMVKAHKTPPAEPGFSLDPKWNVARLRGHLEAVLKDFGSWVATVRKSVPLDVVVDERATPIRVYDVRILAHAAGTTTVEPLAGPWREKIEKIVALLPKTWTRRNHDVDDAAMVELYRFEEELREAASSSDDDALYVLDAAIKFIFDDARIQGARYDGPLQGTRVGMVLFYTDLLAKLWASVDYYGSAPATQIPGFISGARHGEDSDPQYWAERWQYPSTRLWFGPRREGYAAIGEEKSPNEINFSHVATRVYSAGSNPLVPGKEEAAAESDRRCFGWWNAHFSEVADYEQEYHEQNQIMKWSVVTGWLVEADLLRELNQYKVSYDYRFDRWYRDPESGLTFRDKDIRLLPEEEWIGDPPTECMEILRSYESMAFGKPAVFIEGGVSLGGKATLKEGSLITSKVSPMLRRAGLAYEESSVGGAGTKLRLLKGSQRNLATEISLVEGKSGAAVSRVVPHAKVQLRSRGIEVKGVTAPSTEVTVTANAGRTQIGVLKVGDLSLREAPGAVELTWKSADAAAEARSLERYARVLGESRVEPAGALARSESFLPSNDAFVFKPQSGNPIVVMDRTATGGSSRIFKVGRLDPGVPATETAHASGAAAKPTTVSASDVGKASSVLDSAKYQRISAIQGADPATEGIVERVFVEVLPEKAGTAIRVDTGVPELGVLDGRIVGKEIFLERKSGTALNDAFNRVVDRTEMNGRWVNDVVERAAKGETEYHLAPRAVSKAKTLGDSVKERLDLVQHGLDQTNPALALDEYRHALRHDSMQALREGKRSVAADWLREGAKIADGPERTLFEATAAFARGDAKIGVESLAGLLDQGQISPRLLDQFIEGLDVLGESKSIQLLKLRSGRMPSVSRAIEQGTSLGLDGRRAILQTKLPDGTHLRPVFTKGPRGLERLRERLASARQPRDIDIYIESGINPTMDFDEMPGPSIAKLLGDESCSWTYVDRTGLGGLDPDVLVHKGTRFVHRGAREVGPGPILLVGTRDRFGQLSEPGSRPSSEGRD